MVLAVNLKQKINEGFLLFDGAMGTMLQIHGLLLSGELPDVLNITNPQAITDIHKGYVNAGSNVATTNTFGANAHKLKGSGYTVEEVVSAAVGCAKKSGAEFCALGIGPTGEMLEPMGTLSFEAAYELFAEQVRAGVKSGADLIICETFSDLLEIRAAVLAAKENSNLPIVATMTFADGARTFVGVNAMTAAVTLSALGVDALGVNCSMGPAELMPIVRTMLEYSKVPVAVQANAGLPCECEGQVHYDVTPEDYAATVAEMLDSGVKIVGGCCGTTPKYIKLLRGLIDSKTPVTPIVENKTICCSGTEYRVLDGKITVIGERINPTGKKHMKEALRENRMDYIIGEAIDQTNSGADVLDINVGLPEIDEVKKICEVVRAVSAVSSLPLQIDSTDTKAVEAAVRIYNGVPIINSVNGKQESMDTILPIVKKYGTLVVALALDENGIPETAEKRFTVAQKIVDEAAKYGIPKENILVDCLVLTASAQQDQVIVTLDAIKLVKSRLGCKTVLGISNVSFGLPNRPLFNSMFLSAAFGAGLDAPIINPMAEGVMQAVNCFCVCNNQDKSSKEYIEKYAVVEETQNATVSAASETDLYKCIVEGRKFEAAKVTKQMLLTNNAAEIIYGSFVPALDYVGNRFEQGKLFLPQLMQSAAAVQKAFEVIKANSDKNGLVTETKGKIILATVKGDIHDIGKNIVKMMLANYGYDILDLGRDVDPQIVVDTAIEQDIKLVGLSALMTTTVVNMKDTITALKAVKPECKVMVGGAVLTEEYAKMVGADYYAKDAQQSVRVANEFFIV